MSRKLQYPYHWSLTILLPFGIYLWINFFNISESHEVTPSKRKSLVLLFTTQTIQNFYSILWEKRFASIEKYSFLFSVPNSSLK